MNKDAIYKLLQTQLQLVRGRAPEDHEVGAWFRDLLNRLGSLQPSAEPRASTDSSRSTT